MFDAHPRRKLGARGAYCGVATVATARPASTPRPAAGVSADHCYDFDRGLTRTCPCRRWVLRKENSGWAG
jgi:hypothetical protein